MSRLSPNRTTVVPGSYKQAATNLPLTGRASDYRLERPVIDVWAMDDDGAWRLARVLHQYREHGRWRAVVTYTTAPGFTYIRAEWADDLRAHVGGIIPAEGRDRSDSSSQARDNH